jgi:hypothetical protein
MTDIKSNNEYSVRALYEVIKYNLLLKDRDLVHFIRTMGDNIINDVKKINKTPNITLEEINNKYENYIIVYMMVKNIMKSVKISNYQENARDITDFLLKDELFSKPDKPKSSIYDNDE